jgi:serine protease Do
LRLAHDGYRDFELTIELGSTGTTAVLATLQAADVAPPSPPKPQPATGRPAPKAYLGVSIQNLTPESAKAFAAPDTSGALVEQVDPRGPAAAAGLQSGDVIRSFKGKALASAAELIGLVGAEEPGTEIGLEILRNGRALSLQVRLATPPTEARVTSFRVNQGSLAGLTLIELTDFWRKLLALPAKTQGVIVANIDPNSPAANAGIAKGDIIEEVNREKVSSLDDFRALAERAGGSVLLLLNRRGKARFFKLAAKP